MKVKTKGAAKANLFIGGWDLLPGSCRGCAVVTKPVSHHHLNLTSEQVDLPILQGLSLDFLVPPVMKLAGVRCSFILVHASVYILTWNIFFFFQLQSSLSQRE